MMYKSIEEIRDTVEEFTATHEGLMRWFNMKLDEFLSQPYFHLLDQLHHFMEKTEWVREQKAKARGYEFNHRIETFYLVRMYTYNGALQMLDPLTMASREEVIYEFIEAYIELNRCRNEANRERRERQLNGIAFITYDPDDVYKFRVDREKTYEHRHETVVDPDFESAEAEMCLSQYLEVLNSLTLVQRRVFDELAANPDKTHSEIARERLKMDPAQLCRTLRRIEERFKPFLKKEKSESPDLTTPPVDVEDDPVNSDPLTMP